MKAIIVNYRIGRHTQKPNHIILDVDGVNSREKAESLIGKEIVWKSTSGKEIKGKISSAHGNKGNVRVIFEKGLPGQALGTSIKVE